MLHSFQLLIWGGLEDSLLQCSAKSPLPRFVDAKDQSPPEKYFLYLHGFPDQSLDHRTFVGTRALKACGTDR